VCVVRSTRQVELCHIQQAKRRGNILQHLQACLYGEQEKRNVCCELCSEAAPQRSYEAPCSRGIKVRTGRNGLRAAVLWRVRLVSGAPGLASPIQSPPTMLQTTIEGECCSLSLSEETARQPEIRFIQRGAAWSRASPRPRQIRCRTPAAAHARHASSGQARAGYARSDGSAWCSAVRCGSVCAAWCWFVSLPPVCCSAVWRRRRHTAWH